MNRAELTPDQEYRIRRHRIQGIIGLGILAADMSLLTADISDNIDLELGYAYHALPLVMGLGLSASAVVALREVRQSAT